MDHMPGWYDDNLRKLVYLVEARFTTNVELHIYYLYEGVLTFVGVTQVVYVEDAEKQVRDYVSTLYDYDSSGNRIRIFVEFDEML